MRPRRLVTLVTALAALTGSMAATAPALAQSPAAAGQGAWPAGSGPPPPGGGTYSHTVYSHVTIDGQPAVVDPGQLPAPVQCWLEPRFTGDQSWQQGDPLPSPVRDADSYWFWFSGQEPGFSPLSHDPQAIKALNKAFKSFQGKSGWWQVPAWVDGSGGMACALGMVSRLRLNNGFLDFTPPGPPGDAIDSGPINPMKLAYLARAALRLPPIEIITNPRGAGGRATSDVNLPVWVGVAYQGPREPARTARLPLPDGSEMWATVTTKIKNVRVSSNAPGVRLYQDCHVTGSHYNGNPAAIPPCGATFPAPSTGGPFALTVTVTWAVNWADSNGRTGSFPPATQASSEAVTVREIQSVNNGG